MKFRYRTTKNVYEIRQDREGEVLARVYKNNVLIGILFGNELERYFEMLEAGK